MRGGGEAGVQPAKQFEFDQSDWSMKNLVHAIDLPADVSDSLLHLHKGSIAHPVHRELLTTDYPQIDHWLTTGGPLVKQGLHNG